MPSFHQVCLRAYLLCFGLLAIAGPAHAKARYIHATIGNIDIVSSMSEARTTRFLHELVGIRLVIEDLLGTPVLQSATQVVVFGSQPEMDEFYRDEPWGLVLKVKWSCSTKLEGDTFSVVNDWPNDKLHRQAALKAHASWLISQSLPECPFWIYDGLAEFLCTLEYREGTVRLGASVSESQSPDFLRDLSSRPHVIRARRIPLDETLNKPWASRDVCGLWRMWLTTDYDGSRAKIRRLADRIRNGTPANAGTVSQVFGQPLAELQAALYKHMRGFADVSVDRPAPTAGLIDHLTFQPATDFEMAMARGMILASADARRPDAEAGLRALAVSHPDSPRPHEALARLAMVDRNQAAANEHWLQAAARHSLNSYAYLVALRAELEGRTARINLQPSLTASHATELRQIADRCVALNPGQFEAHYWLAWIEALALDPRSERVDLVRNSQARFLKPGTFLPLAIANIRLERAAEAATLLNEYEKLAGPHGKNQPAIEFLRKRIP